MCRNRSAKNALNMSKGWGRMGCKKKGKRHVSRLNRLAAKFYLRNL